MRIPECLCIKLGSLFRKTFKFESPFDVADPAEQEALFQGELTRGLSFMERFSDPADIRGKTIVEIGCGRGGMLVALQQEGPARAVGIDVDRRALVFARKKLRQKSKIFLLEADAQAIPLASASADLVVTDASLEHIHDIQKTLAEVARILRPSGRLYADFGPTWLSYNGPHLIKCISIPWAHLFFSRKTIVNVLEYYKQQETFPPSYIVEKIADFQHMGRLTRKKFNRAAAASGMKTIQEMNCSPRKLVRFAARLPLFRELLAGGVRAVLEK